MPGSVSDIEHVAFSGELECVVRSFSVTAGILHWLYPSFTGGLEAPRCKVTFWTKLSKRELLREIAFAGVLLCSSCLRVKVFMIVRHVPCVRSEKQWIPFDLQKVSNLCMLFSRLQALQNKINLLRCTLRTVSGRFTHLRNRRENQKWCQRHGRNHVVMHNVLPFLRQRRNT